MSRSFDRTPPRAPHPAAFIAPVLAAALVALAVTGVHDLGTAQGWFSGTSWSRAVVGNLDGLQASAVLVVVGVVIALIGILLTLTALRPARRTHLRASVPSDLWISPAALAALAQSTADRAPGVISATTTRASRRRVVVEVLARDGDDTATEAARQAVASGPGALTSVDVATRSRAVSS